MRHNRIVIQQEANKRGGAKGCQDKVYLRELPKQQEIVPRGLAHGCKAGGAVTNSMNTPNHPTGIKSRGMKGLDYGLQRIWVQDEPKAKSSNSRKTDRTFNVIGMVRT